MLLPFFFFLPFFENVNLCLFINVLWYCTKMETYVHMCTYLFWLLQFVQLLKKCYVVLNAIKVSAWILTFSLLQKLIKKKLQGIYKQKYLDTNIHHYDKHSAYNECKFG